MSHQQKKPDLCVSLTLAVCYNKLLVTETFYLNSVNANKLKKLSASLMGRGSNHLDIEIYGFTSNSAHAEVFSTVFYLRSSYTPWESDQQWYTEAFSADFIEISVDLAPQVPLSAKHHISCSLHFVAGRGLRGKKTVQQHSGKSHLFAANQR